MKKCECSSDFGAYRYKYDCGECSYKNGWAQLDTAQDASYFGTWINPTTRKIKTYCEGDVTVITVDTDAELVAEVQHIHDWNEENGFRLHEKRVIAIDPGFAESPIRTAMIAAGLEKFFH